VKVNYEKEKYYEITGTGCVAGLGYSYRWL
jgi:hypothetical protein